MIQVIRIAIRDMKIALVTRGFSKTWGGAEMVAVNLATAMVSSGMEVDVYAERLPESPRAPVEGIRLFKVPLRRGLNPVRSYSFHKNVSKMLKERKYDVVFGLTHFFPQDVYRASGGVHAHWVRLRYPSAVMRMFGFVISPASLAVSYLERSIMRRGGHKTIIVNSKLVKDHMHKYFDLPDEDVQVVYNGVDHTVYNEEVRLRRDKVRGELGIEDSDIVVLYVSNNWKRKGLKTLIAALREVPGTRAIVVGRGRKERYRAELQGMEDRVSFLGKREDVDLLYGAADIFVLPTQYDPCSNACMEAMACNLPVITSRSNGASEFIEDGVSGYLLDDWQDSKTLAKRIQSLKEPRLRSAIGQKAAEKMKAYPWQRTMEETLKVLASAAGSKGSRSGRD